MKIVLNHSYEELISVENLLLAWQEFLKAQNSKIKGQNLNVKFKNNITFLGS